MRRPTRPGRPRTFPSQLLPEALRWRELGLPWGWIAREMGVREGTLRARASDLRKFACTKPPRTEVREGGDG